MVSKKIEKRHYFADAAKKRRPLPILRKRRGPLAGFSDKLP